ncbi:Ig-like domain-containing protein (plasmid) [Vibrio sp. nBUS_14]|uniref:Ig-like domain-containing protein n=1 Tax=Vibrio sp. nBUS_14 TaxID=3395321 RepID=UPI003EBBA442
MLTSTPAFGSNIIEIGVGAASLGIAALAISSNGSSNQDTTNRDATNRDATVPTIATLEVSSDNVVNLEDDVAAVTFSGTTTGVEDGQTVTLDIGGIQATAVVSSDAFSGTADLSSLADGTTLPVHVDVMDVAGNAAPTFSGSIDKDTSAPSINSLVVSTDDVVNLEDDVAAVAFSGTTTGVEDGQTVTLDIGGIQATAVVSSDAFSGTADLSSLADGTTLPVQVDVMDVAGNEATKTGSFTKGTTTPSIDDLTISDNNIVNREDPEDKVTFNGTTSNVEDGQTVTLDIEGVTMTAVVIDNAFSGTVNLTGVSDGAALAVQADVSDALGNAATFTSTIVKDTAAPTITELKISDDGFIDSGDTDLTRVSFEGTTTGVEDGQTVTLDIGGLPVTAEMNGNTFSGTADLSALADGATLAVLADVKDVAGNAAPTFTSTIAKDTTAPSIDSVVVSSDNVVNSSDVAAVAFSGTTTGVENGQTVTLDIGGVEVTAVVSGDAFSGTVSLTGVSDGAALAVQADVSDALGNAATFTSTIMKDKAAPTITELKISDDGFIDSGDTDLTRVSFEGTTTGVEDDQTVTLDIGGLPVTAEVIGNAFSGTADLSALADGATLAVLADVKDVAGNAAPTFTSTIAKDTTAPSIDSVVVSSDNVVNSSDVAAVAFSGTTTGVEDGQTVTLDIGGVEVTAVVSGDAFSGTVNLTEVSDGAALAVQANVSDVAGNAAPTFTSTIAKDTAAPSIDRVSVSTDDIIDSGDTDLTSVTFDGTTTGVEVGQTVTVSIGGLLYYALVEADGTFEGTADVSLLKDNNALPVEASVSDQAGNPASPVSKTIVKDVDTPPQLFILDDDADNIFLPSESATITFQFSEPVQGFTDSDIVVTGGNLTTLSAETVNPDGTVEYTAMLSPLASTAESDGVISISVADNTFIDLNLLNGRGATERYELQTQVTVPTGASVSEANSFGAEIGALTFDGSGDAKLGYTWVLSDSRFEVVGDKLMLKAGQSLDFDTEPSITFDVTLSNSGYKEETQSVTVSVTDASTTNLTEGRNIVEGGTIGDDMMLGSSDDDWFYGNQGDDDLFGGSGDRRGGQDIFVYKGLDGKDTIHEFDASVDGDKIDLSELLSFSHGDTLSDFIEFTNEGTRITLKIDSDGGNNFVSPDVEIYLDNYITSIASPLTLDDLENNNFIL